MNILITGANGFLAQNISKKLIENNLSVTSISRKNNFDLRNTTEVSKFFENKYFDVVLHCAISGGSRLKEDTADIVNDNVKMALNLIKNKSHFGKIINFGSGAELDRSFNLHDSVSVYDVVPEDYYGFSKNIISRLFLNESNSINLRIFNVFSAIESQGRMISTNIKNYINKKPIVIHQDRYMDFIYFDDFFTILMHVLNNDTNLQEINCVYNKKYMLSDIASFINKLDHYKVEVIIESSDIGNSYCGINKLQDLDFIGLEKSITKVHNILL
jgi:nucleoside-diphosphate-sugar epimerase